MGKDFNWKLAMAMGKGVDWKEVIRAINIRKAQGDFSSRIEAKITAFAVESRGREAAAMSIAAMGELEKRRRLGEEAVQRRLGEFCYPLDSSVSEGGGKGKVEAEERQTPAKENKRKMVGREEVEAKRRGIDKEDGVVVKCSQKQEKGSEGKGMDRRKKDLSLTSLKKRKIAVREEAEAKKRIEGEDGAAVTGMDGRKKETSFPSLKKRKIAEKEEAEATKRISLSSSPVCSFTDSCSYGRVCSFNGSSCRHQADGDADLVSSLHSIEVPRGKRTHLEVS